jgi:hypothetical protein
VAESIVFADVFLFLVSDMLKFCKCEESYTASVVLSSH